MPHPSITEKEYRDRNLIGFEGDLNLKSKLEDLVILNDIDTIIETGTYLGGSTNQFAEMVKTVITVESNSQFMNEAMIFLQKRNNISFKLGSSAELLPNILKSVSPKLLLFLDAHWEQSCPLLAELRAIAQAGLEPIIVIHDWKVPNSDLGYDSYNGQDFTIDWIESSLQAIYKKGFTYEYNNPRDAQGARRGCIFIAPVVEKKS